jgi:hypothetical protein
MWPDDFPAIPMYLVRSFLIAVPASLALDAAPCLAHETPGAEVAAAGTVAVAHPVAAVPMPLGRLQVLEPAPALFGGGEPAASALGAVAAPGGTLTDLASARQPAAQPWRVSRRAPHPAESVDSPLPRAPGGGTAFLTGLAVVLFVAYRKLSFKA